MQTLQIPLDPGDEIASMAHSPRYGGAPILLVITKRGYLFEIDWGADVGYVVHKL